MLTINDLRNKLAVMIDGAPYQVLEVKHLHMGRGGSSVQTKIRNLITAQTFNRNFKPSDTFEEADVEKRELVFLYAHRREYVFAVAGNPAERFTLTADRLGEVTRWLKAGTPVTGLFVSRTLAIVSVPIKMDFRVSAAPPGIKGDTAAGGTKTVTLETGAIVQAPLFVNEGDVIRVNTEAGEYAERVSKG